MKHRLFVFAVLLMAMIFPHYVKAYDYSAVSPSGHVIYYTIRNGEASVVKGWQSYTLSGEVIIPDTVILGGVQYPVVSIGDISYANNPSGGYMDMVFAYDSMMIGITLPGTIRNINALAFYQCKGLQNVTIPNSVTTMGDHAFAYCDNLVSVSLSSSLQKIEEDAFVFCNSLISVIIPEGVKELEREAFASCESLQSVSLPASMEIIGEGAFQWTPLSSISIPSSVKRIPRYTFWHCTQLSSVILNEGLQYIDMKAFASCAMLNSLVIPSTVDTILDWTELNYTGVQSITIKCPPTVSVYYYNDGPEYLNSNITITVPCELMLQYSTTNHWQDCENIEGDVVWNLSLDSTAHGNVQILTQPSCDVDAVINVSPDMGYHFVAWSDGDTANPRTIHLSADTTMSALFAIDTHTVTLNVSNSDYGSVDGAGTYTYGTQVFLFATPNCGFQFIRWSNGVTDNPYTLTLLTDTVLTALITPFYDTVLIRDTTTVHDTIYIDVLYAVHDTTYVDVHDTAYVDVHDTTYVDVPYPIHDTTYIDIHDTTIRIDTLYLPVYLHDTAYVAVHDTTIVVDTLTVTEYVAVHDTTIHLDTLYLPVYLHDTSYVAIHDTTTLYDTVTLTEYVPVHYTTYVDVPYPVHDTTVVIDTVTLTEYVPVHDTTYIDVHDTTYIDIHDTTYVDVYVHDTTYVDVPYPVHDTTIVVDTLTLTEYVPIHDTTYINVHDTTYVNVPYPVHDTTYITLTDTVTNTVYDTVDNFIYDTTIVVDTLWLTEYDTLWLHDTIIVHDTVYITEEGIDGVDAINAKVYSSQGQVVVEGAEGNQVTLYDVTGRVISGKRKMESGKMSYAVPTSGVYLIKIGNYPARRVVVVR